ncbi:hypothetical protein [Bacillus pseudomycoides]|nr:hypothetical protein [Bacillus pseudomycoides]
MTNKQPTQQDLKKLKAMADHLQGTLNRYKEHVEEEQYYKNHAKKFSWNK